MDDLLDKIIRVFSDNRLFEEGVQLIGSWCYRFYQLRLGAPKYPLRTQDIDFLIPYPYRGPGCPLVADLAKVGFLCEFNNDGSMYLANPELKIEFLTALKGKGEENPVKIRKLGLSVVALRYTDMLIRNSIALDDGGIQVRLPSPEAFCLHKLLIASKRIKEDKRLKDAEQAILTSTIADRTKLLSIYLTLPKRWRATILSTLLEARREFPLLEKEVRDLYDLLKAPN
jgi:hypothetical protein